MDGYIKFYAEIRRSDARRIELQNLWVHWHGRYGRVTIGGMWLDLRGNLRLVVGHRTTAGFPPEHRNAGRVVDRRLKSWTLGFGRVLKLEMI
jgi:hypothetical protein